MIQNDDRLVKKNEKEKREYDKIREKLFLMSLGKNKDDFKKYLNIKRQKTNYGTLTNRVYDLIKFLHWFPNRRIIEIDEDEILNFFCDLDEDSIKYISTKKRKKGDNSEIKLAIYTYETKITIKKSLKTYFRTLLGEFNYIKRYPNLKGLKTYYNPTERPYITFDNCKTILKGILDNEKNIERKLRDMFVVSFLFEMGCRCCELKAMKLKDIYYDNNIKKWVVFIPKVKTFERTIAIELFEVYITKYINYLIKEKKLSLETKIIDLADKTIREIVNKNSVKYLGNDFDFVTTHILRHSSAFFFTKEKTNLNYQDFTKRFGWSIKSKEANRYFDKNRIITSEIVDSVSKSEVLKYESKYNEQEEKLKSLEEKDLKRENEISEQNLKIEMLMNAIKTEKIEKLKNKTSTFRLPVTGEGMKEVELNYNDNTENVLIEKLDFVKERELMIDYCNKNIIFSRDEGNCVAITMKWSDFDKLWDLASIEMKKQVFMDDFQHFKKWVGYILLGYKTSLENQVQEELRLEFPDFTYDLAR